MSLLKVNKVISALPSSLEADSIYIVRVGAGFDMYVTDATGSIAYASNGGGGGTPANGNPNFVAKFNALAELVNSIIFDDGTNVGINTTSPGYPLHLYKASSETGILTSFGSFNIYLSHGGWGMGAGRFGIGNGTTPSIVINAMNNNVGIGTTNPTEKLHVDGNILIPVSKSLFLVPNSTNYGIGTPNSDGVQIFTANGDWIRFGHMTGVNTFIDRMVISATGNVGIATISPSEKLDVAGRARIQTVDNVTGDIVTVSATGVLQKRTVTQVKSDIGLSNVDNTSDANKPVSTAQQTALNTKENTANKTTSFAANITSNVLFPTVKAIYDWAVALFQPLLVSGTNIKTLNGASLLGGGDISLAPTSPQITLITLSTAWIKPAGSLYHDIYLVSGGGGGGSGRRGASASNRYGGGGGSSGVMNAVRIFSDQLGATENVWIGAGGTGGAASTANDTNGNGGNNGAFSMFGGNGTVANAKVSTVGSIGGGAGTSSIVTANRNNSWIFGQLLTSDTIASSTYPTTLTPTNGSLQNRWLCYGGAGGSISAGNGQGFAAGMEVTGASPSQIIYSNLLTGNVSGADGIPGTLYTNTVLGPFCSLGGTGGNPGNTAGTVRGGDGANGAPGAGGGGGGASTNGSRSGAGGKGGDGFCIIISYFQ